MMRDKSHNIGPLDQAQIYQKTNLQALRQALGMTNRKIPVVRQKFVRYNEKGRPDHKEFWETIDCTVIRKGSKTEDKKDGKGSWTKEFFSITYVYPEYLHIGNFLKHPEYGLIRIETIVDDQRDYGASQAEGVRVGSISPIDDRGEYRITEEPYTRED